MQKNDDLLTPIPTRWVGPMRLSGNIVEEEAIDFPLATYETPLWASCTRGAKVSQYCDGGIVIHAISSTMSRSIVLEGDHAGVLLAVLQQIEQDDLQKVVAETSRFAQLQGMHSEIVGNLLYLRFAFFTGDASGHNMVTKACDALMRYFLETYPQLRYRSISSNFCTDKKVSAVNGILGRGHRMVAEMLIPEKICQRLLRTSAEKMVALNLAKNYVGSNLAGSLRSANAHFANMLLASYLATGQDAANIIEGSQGFVHCENRNGDLYFSCTFPNLIVGSVGNGKGNQTQEVEERLRLLGCREERAAGQNAQRLAALIAGITCCGELSLLAAQTNPGELIRAHLTLERQHG